MRTEPPRWRSHPRDVLRAYARGALHHDLVAACIVSVLLIPQSLAYALLAGLPPQVGLYASLLPLVAYAMFGSSPAMCVGPVAVLALMISQALAQVPAAIGPQAAALVLAAEVGLLLAAAAWLRLDALAALLSVPVLHGFETGAALWRQMLPSALLIALVAFVSSLVVAESLARRQGLRIQPRRELAGVAAANLAAALGSGMPVAGSFSRSVVNLDAGGRTRMTGVFTAALMGLAILLLAQPLAALPTAVLAATIIVAVLSVLDWRPFREAWHYSRSECVLMSVVAILTLLLGVAWALGVGVAVSIALLLQRTARPHVALIGRVAGTEHYRNVGRHEVALVPGVMALRIDESLLFINARQLSDVVQQHLAQHPATKRLVLLMSPVNRIDFSGLEALRALHDMLEARGIRLDLSEVKGPVLDGLRAADWSQWFAGRVFLSHHQAMLDTAPASAQKV